MVRLDALRPLHAFVARYFEHPRVREAFSFHSLFIGGDPYRVPAIYGALVYLQVLDGGWYAEGGMGAVVEAMAAPLDVRCGERVEAIEHAGGRVTGVRLAGGERIAADVVVSNADVLRTHELVGRPAPRRRLRETMSCFLLYLGTDRRFERLRHHTLLVGDGYREFIRGVTRGASCRGRSPPTCTRRRAPSRRWPPPGGDSLAVLLPGAEPARGDRLGARGRRAARRAPRRPRDDVRARRPARRRGVEHRMTPLDFARELGAVWGNAFAVEPTLHQSAYFRQPNRDRRIAGLYLVGGGTHPGAGVPGVLLGRRSRPGWSRADRGLGAAARRARGGRAGGVRRRRRAARAALVAAATRSRRRATTHRVARTFALACRLLPRPLRDDVYLLYLVFRTLDDLVDDGQPEAAARVAAVEAWAPASPGSGRARSTCSRRRGAPPAPPRRARRLLRGHALGPRAAEFATEAELDAYCYRVAGTVGIVMAAVLGTTTTPRRAGRRGARHGDAADEHPARPRRGPRRRALLPRPRDARPLRAAGPRRARRRCCATRSPGRRALRGGPRGRRAPALRAWRGPGRGVDVPRDPAPDRARGLRRRPGRAVVARRRKLWIAARVRSLTAAGACGEVSTQPSFVRRRLVAAGALRARGWSSRARSCWR